MIIIIIRGYKRFQKTLGGMILFKVSIITEDGQISQCNVSETFLSKFEVNG